MPDDEKRRVLLSAAYSPRGMAEYLAYRDDLDERVRKGWLNETEAHILSSIRMQGIILEGGGDQAIRRPKCEKCGELAAIIGRAAQTFRCPCSPDLEQSITDRVRAAKDEASRPS